MALSIGERFGELRDCDWVNLLAGRIVSAQSDGNEVRLVVDERGSNRLIEIDAAWVINCTRPAPSNSAAANPAIGSLLVDGFLRPDELGLGVDTVGDGNAVSRDGHIVPDLFVVGNAAETILLGEHGGARASRPGGCGRGARAPGRGAASVKRGARIGWPSG